MMCVCMRGGGLRVPRRGWYCKVLRCVCEEDGDDISDTTTCVPVMALTASPHGKCVAWCAKSYCSSGVLVAVVSTA
jgi:hypothetical protein